MNASDTSENGWAQTAMRTYLRETILPTLPQEIRSHIAEVTKTYRTKSPNDETLSIADNVWIPSAKELGLIKADTIESDGVVYGGNVIKFVKYSAGTANTRKWWLRSAISASEFSCITEKGISSYTNANKSCYIVLGFCTNP